MTRSRNLGVQARDFAGTLQGLLNKTICDHAQVNAVVQQNTLAIVGTRITDLTSHPIPTRSSARSKIWIDISCRLRFDEDENLFLTVERSYCGISVGRDGQQDILLHYDYERDKEHYAEAHLQVCARHDSFEQYLQELNRADRLGKIHLPVGGRRFRPALEDLIECLIVEKLVTPKPGWRLVLNETRKNYRLSQISAVVRRNPGTAIKELKRLGYAVVPPRDESVRARIVRLLTPKQRGADADDEVVSARS